MAFPKAQENPDLIRKQVCEPAQCGQCNVYALQDRTGRAVCMRVYRTSDRSAEHTIATEVKVRQAIEREGVRGFQQLLAYSETGNELIGAPFVALSWAHGASLVWTDKVPARREDRDKVIRAVVEATLDLLKIHEPGTSAKSEIVAKINRKIDRAVLGRYPGGNKESCIAQMDLLEAYWISELDNAPRVLVLGDLPGNNIIVGEEYNVQR